MTIQLRSGDKLPAVGLGTWKSKPNEVYEAVKSALDVGYSHIDCALVYENEAEVGRALKEKLGTVITRKELWLTGKLWNTMREPDLIRPALMQTLKDLGVDYIDLFLIHWPQDFESGGALFPKDASGKVKFGKTDYVEVWKTMEKFVDEGLVRNIGVSNFNHKQIERLLSHCRIKPAVNQFECHPYLSQEKLVKFCHDNGIHCESYAPIGAPDRSWAKPGDPLLLDDPVVKAIAAHHKKTPGQVLLRYHIERGLAVLPKSVTPSRIAENLNIFDFKLSAEEMAQLLALNRNHRFYLPGDETAHPHYPFSEEF